MWLPALTCCLNRRPSKRTTNLPPLRIDAVWRLCDTPLWRMEPDRSGAFTGAHSRKRGKLLTPENSLPVGAVREPPALVASRGKNIPNKIMEAAPCACLIRVRLLSWPGLIKGKRLHQGPGLADGSRTAPTCKSDIQ